MNDAVTERVRSALSHLNPHDRPEWVDMAFAIKDEFGDAGFDLWDEWGSAHQRPASEVKATWRSARPGGKIGLGTLIYRAKQAGWKDDTKYKKPSKAEIDARNKAAEERAALYQAQEAAEQEAAAERAKSIWDAAAPADAHPYLQRKGVSGHGLRVADWHFEWADRDTGEVHQSVSKNCLLVPMLDRQRNLHSLQAIEPIPNGKKRYLPDGAKRGHFYPIGKPQHDQQGRTVFMLGEGYATCASAHECTHHMALVCFDASNLAAVAAVIRERSPDAVILFLADNDLGTDGNPGLTIARKAAAAVAGVVAVPMLSAQPQPAKNFDFNDLHMAEGVEAVRALIDLALQPPAPAAEQEPAQELAASAAPAAPAPAAAPAQPPVPVDPDGPDDLHASGHFTVLGYDQDTYYFFHHGKKQVLARTKGDFSDMGLVELAPRQWWEMYYPKSPSGFDKISAAEWIFGLAHARGIYDPKRVRGRGAWTDKGRLVFHHGDHLTVDGVSMPVTSIKSGFVYSMAKTMPSASVAPATDEQGRHLLEVAKLVRWNMPASSALMAGWVFLAPVCGALKWRPHIWLTGPAGSGKSTIQSDYCQALVRGISEYFQGDSTSPGIRQDLRADAIPALVDEMEPNDETDRKRISSILTMIRQSSSESEAKTAKGTVNGSGMHFHIRSMFCVASINTMLDKDSDSSRLTPLVIRAPGKTSKAEVDQWDTLKDHLHVIGKDDEWPSRLLARSLGMLPTILASVEVFTRVAAAQFGSQRHGDQFGTLMAGAWCLQHGMVPTEAQAKEMLTSYNWSEHHEEGSPDDPLKALGTVMEAKIRVNNVDLTVFELVADAYGKAANSIELGVGIAVDALNRHGMRIVGHEIVFANSSPALRELVAKTPYYSDLKGQMLRVPGANNFGNKTLKFSGLGSKCVAVPLSFLFDPGEPAL